MDFIPRNRYTNMHMYCVSITTATRGYMSLVLAQSASSYDAIELLVPQQCRAAVNQNWDELICELWCMDACPQSYSPLQQTAVLDISAFSKKRSKSRFSIAKHSARKLTIGAEYTTAHFRTWQGRGAANSAASSLSC